MGVETQEAGWRSTIGWFLKRAVAAVVVVGWIVFWVVVVRLHLRDGDVVQAGVTAGLFVAPAFLLSLWVLGGTTGRDWPEALPVSISED